MDAVGQSPSHCGTGLEGAQYRHGFDGGAREVGGHVVGDARESDDLDLEPLTGCHDALEICAAVVLQARPSACGAPRSA